MSDQTRGDHFLELAILARLHMHAIEAQHPARIGPTERDEITLWEAHCDAAIIAMLAAGGRNTGDGNLVAKTRDQVEQLARLVLHEHTTGGRTRGWTGHILPEAMWEDPEVDYAGAIEAQEITLAAAARLGVADVVEEVLAL